MTPIPTEQYSSIWNSKPLTEHEKTVTRVAVPSLKDKLASGEITFFSLKVWEKIESSAVWFEFFFGTDLSFEETCFSFSLKIEGQKLQ